MKKLDKAKKLVSLLKEAVILAGTLDEDERELLIDCINYDNAKQKYEKSINKFE